MAMRNACISCRFRKRKCDRAFPTCGRCEANFTECIYIPQKHCRAVQLAAHAPDVGYTGISLSPLFEPYPIPRRWYMPRLLQNFIDGLGVSQVPVHPGSMAWSLQTVWMQHALGEPCLFHATLFLGSSYSDMLRGERASSSITLFHQSEVLRLVGERLGHPVLGIDDCTIAAITPLASSAGFRGDRDAARIHQAGMRRMVELRGGHDKLGMGGLVAALLRMNSLVCRIAFNQVDHPSTGGEPTLPPSALEIRILNSLEDSPGHDIPVQSIRSIIQVAFNAKLQANSQVSPALDRNNISIPEDPIYQCCYLAMTILLFIVQQPLHPSKTLNRLVHDLKSYFTLTDTQTWLRYLPEVYSWVCMIGAAATDKLELRIWFYFRQASALRLTSLQNGGFMDELWAHFEWLRERRSSRAGAGG
ncbi:hypothetical protein BJX68DRAFT_34599 [Aspergillus pseudodeflectus]|uniref:Zn(2)-C6 fungal-type domain-containing protein n=1 Tax=Aspergillus pseudodeflectus TaxID=176178 RepID=A0ABR4J9A7_9EURO